MSLAKAISITEKCFSFAQKNLKPGITEKLLAGEIKKYAKQLGAQGFSFPILIGSGKRSAIVHCRPTKKKIRENEFIIIDFGIKYSGVLTDMTRTFCINPDKKKIKLYNLVLQAQKLALKEIKPGIKGKVPALKVKQFFSRNRCKKYLKHALGHGIGKKIHQKPRVHSRSEDILTPGVIAIEPGLYIKGFGGIRIEDMVLLTKKSKKILTNFPKKLKV